MVRFMSQYGYALVPSYSNINLSVTVKLFCTCDQSIITLLKVRKIILDN